MSLSPQLHTTQPNIEHAEGSTPLGERIRSTTLLPNPRPSALSASRPCEDSTAAAVVSPGHTTSLNNGREASTSTSSSFVNSSDSNRTQSPPPPSPLPDIHLADSRPVLLSTLSAQDGESILVLAVEEELGLNRPEHGSATGSGSTIPNSQRHGQPHAGDISTNDERVHNSAGARKAKTTKSKARVYGGSQGGAIHVWDLASLTLRARLTGHTGAVLALQLVPERDWLISASGDGTVRVWHTPTLSPLYLIQPPHDNIGDLHSIAWVPSELVEGGLGDGGANSRSQQKGKGRLYAGCQDTSIQWIDLPPSFHLDGLHPFASLNLDGSHGSTGVSHSPGTSSPPIQRTPSKFFDSLSAARPARPSISTSVSLSSRNGSSTSLVGMALRDRDKARNEDGTVSGEATPPKREEQVIELQFQRSNIAVCAHYGYVYSLLIGKRNDKAVLVSGSGDEDIKLWRMAQHELQHDATLPSSSDAVLALAARDSTVFAGHQGGVIKIWDLDTLTCVRTLRPHAHDILALSVLNDSLYSGAADGTLQRWSKSFQLVSTWPAHSSIVLSSATASGGRLLTGGNDAVVKIWDARDELSSANGHLAGADTKGFQGEMFHTLSKLVSFRTIADEANREECRQGALYLKRVLRQLGADTALLPGARDRNPVVLGTFRANSPTGHPTSKLAPPPPRRRRVLFYGHYDVVTASSDSWQYPPFELTGRDGALYGRGVSDNKGPILAIAAAASELRAQGLLEVDVVMVVEGEEETGSAGFQDAIRSNRHLIGDVDVILVSNSYWIGEDVPCLTFGLRGVVHATLTVKSDQPDLHSGMQGGVVSEPLVDMVRLLASLTDADGRVRIPGFLDDVRKMSNGESALFDQVVERCKGDKSDKLRKHSHVSDPRRSLISRWRQPALSIHDVQSRGPTQKSLIPNSASATVSIRIVPDQSLLDIVEQLKSHLRKSFGSLRTVNTLEIDIDHVADWWLGDIESPYFTALARCIETEWGIKPLYIREGGSIPSLPFLEREFQADAVHFPMGTSSDSAHLPDERIKIVNLEKGKSIVSQWFTALGAMPMPASEDKMST